MSPKKESAARAALLITGHYSTTPPLHCRIRFSSGFWLAAPESWILAS